MDRTVEQIVAQVLNSPELRTTLETTIQTLTNRSASTTVTNAPSSSSSSARQELNRLFPSMRPNRKVNSSTCRSRRRIEEIKTFRKDVILLRSEHSFATLKGSAKAEAYETGML